VLSATGYSRIMNREQLSLRDFLQRGPHPVGVATLDVPDPAQTQRRLLTDVWYPAEPSRFETAVAANHPMNQTHDARNDAAPAPGLFPLIAFSHGNSGLRRQSTFLTTHLASWGFVVTAPDHVGNTLFEMIKITDEDERKRAHLETRENRPRDLATAIDVVSNPPAEQRGRWPEVEPDRIGVLGHSFGGWTAMKMPALDPRVAAVCGLAPASEPFVGRKAFEKSELPFAEKIPTLLVAGLEDVLVDIASSVTPLFDRLAEPRALIGLEGADHFHFCDGIHLLHGLHERNKRPQQTRETQRYADLLQEARTHDALRAVVASFFAATLQTADGPLPELSTDALRELDPALARLDSPA
jgi:predicted dienelactone hydrolase